MDSFRTVLIILQTAVNRGILVPSAAEELAARLRHLPEDQATPDWLVAQGALTPQQVEELRPRLTFPSGSSVHSATVPSPDEGATTLWPLPDIPGYQVVELLGSGGMGMVYKAWQERPRRLVAIKVMIRQRGVSPDMDRRFEREAQATADLAHPGIVTIYELGEANGEPFFSMEFVEGKALDRYVRESNLPIEARLRLVRKVCDAVAYAHQRGVIHRDLKPANILVTPGGQPKILDFGLAKFAEFSEREAIQSLTLGGEVIGTVPYMAPEQTSGRPGETDIRTDVYTLGVLLYSLLCNKLPHEPRDEHALELLRRVREETPPPPRSHNPLINDDLQTIILKALDKEKDRRYQTAGALAADLGHYLAGEPIDAKPPSAAYQVRRLLRRYRAVVIPAVLALAVIVAAATFSYFRVRAERNAAIAAEKAEARQRAEAEAQKELARKAEQAAKASEETVRRNAAQASFLVACEKVEESRPDLALASLGNALRLNPRHVAAQARVFTLLAQRKWPIVVCVMRHQNWLTSAQFSPDGRRVVTAAMDNTARVWDAETGRPIGEPMQHEAVVTCAQFSPDGRRVMTISGLHVVQSWDMETGEPAGKPMKCKNDVQFAEFSTDGRWLLTVSADGAVQVQDAATGEPFGKPMQHESKIASAHLSPDGRRLLTVGGNTAQVWDAATGQPVGEPMQHAATVTCAQFSPDGRRVATASQDKTARLWDAATGLPAGQPIQHPAVVTGVQFSSDGRWLLTTSEDCAVRAWEAATGLPVGETMRHPAAVACAQFSPDARRVVTASRDRAARVWKTATGRDADAPAEHPDAGDTIYAAQISPDARWVATASTDKTRKSPPTELRTRPEHPNLTSVQLWDAATGRPVGEPMLHERNIRFLEISPEGRRLLTAVGNIAQVWDPATGKPVGKALQHQLLVRCARFSPDGRWVVTASRDRTAQVWDAATGQPVGEPMRHGESSVESAQFSPDGRRVVTIAQDNAARAWEWTTGHPIWETALGPTIAGPLRHQGGVKPPSVEFSADGRWVLTVSSPDSWNNTVRVWEAATGKPVGEPMPHQGYIWSAQFSPDGRRVATASADNTARVWEAATGKPVGEPILHQAAVTDAQFSPDGRWLVTSSQDGMFRVWDPETGKPVSLPMQNRAHIYSLRFTPDGRWIVTASADAPVQAWPFAACNPQADAAALAPLLDLAAYCGVIVMEADGAVLRQLTPENLVDLRGHVMAFRGDPTYGNLIRWVLDPPEKAPPSPLPPPSPGRQRWQ